MMPAPSDLIGTITAARRTHEAAVSIRGAIVAGGDKEMIAGLRADLDARFRELGTALGYGVDRLDDDTAREAVEGAGKASRERQVKFMADFGPNALRHAVTDMMMRHGADWLTDGQLAGIVAQTVEDWRCTTRRNIRNRAIMAGHDAAIGALVGER